MTTSPRICEYPPCPRPLAPNPARGGRVRRFCSKTCSDRDYERRNPGRVHGTPAAPKTPLPPLTGPCACGCGVDLSTRQIPPGVRVPRRYASKACANRHYHVLQPNRKRRPTDPTRRPAKNPDRYYDLKPEAIERIMAQALKHVQWRNAHDRMSRIS